VATVHEENSKMTVVMSKEEDRTPGQRQRHARLGSQAWPRSPEVRVQMTKRVQKLRSLGPAAVSVSLGKEKIRPQTAGMTSPCMGKLGKHKHKARVCAF
jgi:hypothetical protein